MATTEKKEPDEGKMLIAFTAICEALKPLTQEGKSRVLRSVAILSEVRLGSGKDLGGSHDDCG